MIPWLHALLAVFYTLLVACGQTPPAGDCPEGPPDFVGESPGTKAIPSTATLDLQGCEGRVVVLNFWATWCGPCRMEIPALVRLREAFPETEVAIIGVSTGEYAQGEQLQRTLSQFVRRQEINYPVFSDEGRLLYRLYNATHNFRNSIPATLVFDHHGNVHSVHRGVPMNASGAIDPYAVIGKEIATLLADRDQQARNEKAN